MSSITISDVKKLATLSALSLDDDEINSLTVELEKILDYVQQLGEVGTADVEPTYQVVDLSNVHRQDIVRSSVEPKELLDGVSEVKNQQIMVPKVI